MVLGHFNDIKGFNSDFRDWVMTYYKDDFVSALEGIDELVDLCLVGQLQSLYDAFCDQAAPLSCHYFDSLDEISRLISFVNAPGSIDYLARSAAAGIVLASDATLKTSIRVYQGAKGVLNLSYLGAMGWTVHKGLTILGDKAYTFTASKISDSDSIEFLYETSQRVADYADGFFGVVTGFYSLAVFTKPVVHLFEVYHAGLIEKQEEADPSVFAECFGGDIENLDGQAKVHLNKYRIMKTALAVNAIVQLIVKRGFVYSVSLTPVGKVILFGSTVLKLSMDYYWSREVSNFRRVEIPANPYKIAKRVTAITSFAVLPLTMAPAVGVYGVGLLALSTAAGAYFDYQEQRATQAA